MTDLEQLRYVTREVRREISQSFNDELHIGIYPQIGLHTLIIKDFPACDQKILLAKLSGDPYGFYVEVRRIDHNHFRFSVSYTSKEKRSRETHNFFLKGYPITPAEIHELGLRIAEVMRSCYV